MSEKSKLENHHYRFFGDEIVHINNWEDLAILADKMRHCTDPYLQQQKEVDLS